MQFDVQVLPYLGTEKATIFTRLSGNVCKSGPLHFGSEKGFPSYFAQETILGHK